MLKTIVSGLLGGLLGAALVWLTQGNSFELWPQGMSFSDLSAILLGGAALILAVLGVALAIGAFWGYTQFAKYIKASVIEHIEKPETIELIVENLEPNILKYLEEELNEGRLKSILEERVDAIIFQGAEIRSKTQGNTEDE